MRYGLKARVTDVDSVKVYNSYDLVGDIAIIKTPLDDVESAKKVAEAIISLYHRRVKTVFMQTSAVQGDFRIRHLKFLAGENRTVTVYKEYGCLFKVDVERCYISPRLLFEHNRISALVAQGEVIVNMFSGVGCFSILIATYHSTKVYSIDINPTAYEFMQENVQLNNVSDSVIPLLGDSKEIVNLQLRGVADRVLMPLPELALEYLPYALLALKPSGGCIHYFDFQYAAKDEDPVEKTCQKVVKCLDTLGVIYRIGFSRVIRSIGPNWYQTVLDIYVSGLPSKFL
ncbi:MAG: class I SAM-dependent methyltransferase family protein [Nitrososphaerota archaeon]|jgi:tRNA (guanine37-N1)-methyltransferase|nr:class I SAM-dependent methyltransferase family protein [Nitrososphaerota archaeon]